MEGDCSKWTTTLTVLLLDEQGQTQKFAELMSDDVDIADAYCGHVLALTESELDAEIDNMS